MKLTNRLLKNLVENERENMYKELQLRKAIKQQVSLVLEAGSQSPSVGKELKGSAKSEKAVEKIEQNPALKSVIDSIKSPNELAAFIQGVIEIAAEEGVDQNALKSAINKVTTASKQTQKPSDK